MSFKTDGGGMALSLPDVKLFTARKASTWNTRLSQIARMNGKIIICTYSLPRMDYVEKILDKRSKDITLVANSKFFDKARILQERYPDMKIHLRPDVHAKLVVAEPHTVWLASANFGSSGWFESGIGIHDKRTYDFFLKELSDYLKEEL